MTVSPAFAQDWDGDGCDEDFFGCYGFWALPAWAAVEYDIDWEDDWDGADWEDDVDCVVEEFDYSEVFEELEGELECGWE